MTYYSWQEVLYMWSIYILNEKAVFSYIIDFI